jgi:hypothetical protein
VDAGAVEVELLGLARLLAGREVVRVAVEPPATLAAVLQALALAAPRLTGTVLAADGALLGGHALTRDGVELLRNPAARIEPGDRLLLLSTSAGG